LALTAGPSEGQGWVAAHALADLGISHTYGAVGESAGAPVALCWASSAEGPLDAMQSAKTYDIVSPCAVKAEARARQQRPSRPVVYDQAPMSIPGVD